MGVTTPRPSPHPFTDRPTAIAWRHPQTHSQGDPPVSSARGHRTRTVGRMAEARPTLTHSRSVPKTAAKAWWIRGFCLTSARGWIAWVGGLVGWLAVGLVGGQWGKRAWPTDARRPAAPRRIKQQWVHKQKKKKKKNEASRQADLFSHICGPRMTLLPSMPSLASDGQDRHDSGSSRTAGQWRSINDQMSSSDRTHSEVDVRWVCLRWVGWHSSDVGCCCCNG